MHLVIRAGLTSSTIMAAGDVLCQKLQKRQLAGEVDWTRTGRFAVVGLCLHGPFFLFGFKWLDSMIKGAPSLKTALAKSALGQVTLFPVYLTSCFTALKMLEGKKLDDAASEVMQIIIPTFMCGSVFWPAANVVNFMFVPASGRVVYVNAAGLVWNAYLSLVNSTSIDGFVKVQGDKVDER